MDYFLSVQNFVRSQRLLKSAVAQRSIAFKIWQYTRLIDKMIWNTTGIIFVSLYLPRTPGLAKNCEIPIGPETSWYTAQTGWQNNVRTLSQLLKYTQIAVEIIAHLSKTKIFSSIKIEFKIMNPLKNELRGEPVLLQWEWQPRNCRTTRSDYDQEGRGDDQNDSPESDLRKVYWKYSTHVRRCLYHD